MTIEQKLFSKLEPHAQRIENGGGNDFDYLPAVLLHLMEEQKRQVIILDDTAKLLSSIKSASDTIDAQRKAQITAFESATQRRMEQIEAAINDTQTQLKNLQTSMNDQVAVLASAHTKHTTQTDESLGAIVLQIESLSSSTQRSNRLYMRLLIAGLVASTVITGLAVAILQRH